MVATENVNRWINSLSYLLGIFAWIVVSLIFVTPREGAMNSAYAAASPEVKARAKEFKGAYLTPIGCIATPSSSARDERLAEELYETSMSLITEIMLND
jgi:hypothetical protein